ncbi:hypothetical protein COZ82_00495 [Candidatus Kaiserbacteria bacterium CG_4_8_14_3_um_filter_38_9]|uniref:Nucleotidyl transferase AbiEii/AbiGii toxin family protein n=1 Tax=Candidatus Kaiserbacteria bacterium CG_4_8_14_3_um_filter_38_9 TaxID=1974599 RepID=A0A2M7IPN1_9BACT|nr:MAG: hypothetical protein COZ82_00495 [Candidatus Kaiserbacteria bacterium CG_4_8_14_3_um_filter_38_9]
MSFDFSKHKSIMLKILKDIYTDTSISSYLAFKGGTAAMLFYGLPRNSVDLDFDILDSGKEELVFGRIQKLVSVYGKITEAIIKRNNILVVISYGTGLPQLKIEINRQQFGSNYSNMSLLGIPMLVMNKSDMFAHKLMAMYERMGRTSRDIFDVRFFAQNDWEINKAMVEKRSGKTFVKIINECIISLEKMSEAHILDGLGELLDERQKDSTRAKLKADTIFQLKLMQSNEK